MQSSILAGPPRCDCLLRRCHQHDQLFGERSHLPRCAVIDSVLDFDDASGRTATRSVDTIIAHISGRMSSRSIGSSRPTCMLTIFPPGRGHRHEGWDWSSATSPKSAGSASPISHSRP